MISGRGRQLHGRRRTLPDRGRTWFGWCMYDWANSAFATVCLSAVLPVYFVGLVPAEGVLIGISGGHRFSASALWGYGVSFSMLVVALAAPYAGAMADRLGAHRRFLAVCCLAGALATCLLALTGPGMYSIVLGLFVAGNICFAGGNIFYNAYLPHLARGPDLDRLSARGFACGYLGGGLALLLVFAAIMGHRHLGFSDPGQATRAGFLFTGLWWALFAVPTLVYLPERAGLHTVIAGPPGGYFKTLAEIRRYPNLLRFLIAFLCYNDGIQTIIVVAAVFGREELGLSREAILGCFLMIQFVAMPGTLLFGRLAARFGARRCIFLSLWCFVLVTAYACFMSSALEFWLLGFVIALIFGGSQAVSRSLYGALVPEGKNAEFFGFFAISAKFASVAGPFLFALIADLTGSTRYSILSLTGFFILGMLLLSTVEERNSSRGSSN